MRGLVVAGTALTVVGGGLFALIGVPISSAVIGQKATDACRRDCLNQFDSLTRAIGIDNQQYKTRYTKANDRYYSSSCHEVVDNHNIFTQHPKLSVTFYDPDAYNKFHEVYDQVISGKNLQGIPCEFEELSNKNALVELEIVQNLTSTKTASASNPTATPTKVARNFNA
ncbi:MAG: hypothetical protein RLZZ210_1728 [Pseudomonadota bacterium]